MSTSEITEEERQGAQHLASLMNLALGSAAGDVGSHQQEAQAAQEARVRGLLSSAAGGMTARGHRVESRTLSCQ